MMWIIVMIVLILLVALAVLALYGNIGGFLSRWQLPSSP